MNPQPASETEDSGNEKSLLAAARASAQVDSLREMADVNEALFLAALRQNQLAEEAAQAREEANAARLEAEAANNAKDVFLAVLSHELRTPLAPILMAVKMLSRTKALPERVADALAMIERNVIFQAQLIGELLDFCSIGRGKLVLERQEVDLRTVLLHAGETITTNIKDKRQSLNFAFDDCDHHVSGDYTRLAQVFTNLFRNASKFTPVGGHIRLRSWRLAGCLMVEVSDNGIGFPPDACDRIFEAFTQATESVTREFGGLGLGLAISRSILHAHGGTLRAHSLGAGQGAAFTAEIPISEAA